MDCVKCKKPLPDGARWCCWCGLKNPFEVPTQNKKARGNGQGSVYRIEKTGLWAAEVTIGYIDGKQQRRRKTGFKTKKAAVEALAELKRPNYTAERNTKVSAIWAKMWPTWERKLSEGKARHYETAYKRLSALHNAQIENLIAQDWQEQIDKIGGRYDPKREAKTVVSAIYKYAIAQGWVTVNMAEHIVLPSQNETKKDSFTSAELDKLWALWRKEKGWAAYILILCYVGTRPGELLQMQTEDVHLDELYMVGGIKSESGRRRCLAFPEWVRPCVEYAVAQSHDGQLLRISETKFYEHYYDTLDRAGIERSEKRPMSPHCCRHTFMSMGNVAGIPLATLQKMAGHSDPSITARYIHAHDPELIKAAQKLYRPKILEEN